jgi:hypothetical protein
MIRRYGSDGAVAGLDDLVRIARAELKRRTRERRALTLLQRGIACPVIKVVEDGGSSAALMFEALSAQLKIVNCDRSGTVAAES